MGNMFARRAGDGSGQRCRSMSGSHLDTQPTGGKFDGVLGVLGALEVIRSLNDLGIRTKHPIEVDQLDQRGGLALRARHGVVRRLRRGATREDCAYARRRRGGQDLRRRAEAHRLPGRGARGRAADPRVLRAAHRAGADPRGRGHRHRRRHPRPGPALVRGHAHRAREPYRLDADAGAARTPARRGAGRSSWSTRSALAHAPHAVGDGGHDQRLPELAQRDPRAGGLHGRLPLARSTRR